MEPVTNWNKVEKEIQKIVEPVTEKYDIHIVMVVWSHDKDGGTHIMVQGNGCTVCGEEYLTKFNDETDAVHEIHKL